VHDSVDLERRGIPTVFVASDVFVDAAKVQGEALGFQPERVFVKHPIQDRTDDEMVALADEAVDALVRAISGS